MAGTYAAIGGDEFAILLEANDLEGVLGIERRMAELQKKVGLILSPYNAGVSMGITQLQPTDTPETLFERADRLMYQEKSIRRREQSQGFVGFPIDLVEKNEKEKI